jgi:hypothetical protein
LTAVFLRDEMLRLAYHVPEAGDGNCDRIGSWTVRDAEQRHPFRLDHGAGSRREDFDHGALLEQGSSDTVEIGAPFGLSERAYRHRLSSMMEKSVDQDSIVEGAPAEAKLP